MKNISKIIGIMVIAVIIFAGLAGCSLFKAPLPPLPFDVASDNVSALSTRAATGIADYPFTEFTKFEVTVYFVYVALYTNETENVDHSDPETGFTDYSQHTLINKPDGEGIKVNLATQKLTDVLEEELEIEDPAGNAIDKIYVGVDTTAVVNGYLYNINGSGGVFRTSPDGPITDDGAAPEDWSVPISGHESIEASSVDESNPPKKSNLYGVYLWLAGGGDLTGHGHTHITVEEDDTFEFRFPIDIGVVKRTSDSDSAANWTTCDVNAGTPYVASSTHYYKYYIKRQGEQYYTDMMRILTDKNGKMILGQLWGTSFNFFGDPKNVFEGEFSVWYNADNATDNSVYDTLFSQNADGTINFSTDDGGISAANFNLLNAPGEAGTVTFTINGTDIVTDYLRVE